MILDDLEAAYRARQKAAGARLVIVAMQKSRNRTSVRYGPSWKTTARASASMSGATPSAAARIPVAMMEVRQDSPEK
jgi:hypothetical protein